MSACLPDIRIVLIGTTHPGNIGAAARAMKTMGQSNLCLVDPKIFPSVEATARASGADDVLNNANVYNSLKEAVADCDYIIGTTARTRSLSWPTLAPRECVRKIEKEHYRSIAILFGRESSGLSNDEIEHCNMLIKIPSNSEYNSLNLASAVQIICYELMLKVNNADYSIEHEEEWVSHEKMELFYTQLEQCMHETGFYDRRNPKKLTHRMRRLFNRAQLNEAELNILRGFLTKILNINTSH